MRICIFCQSRRLSKKPIFEVYPGQIYRWRQEFGAARMAYLGHVLPDGMEPGLDETLFYDPVGMGAPSGVHMAYVEVDPDTEIV